MKSQVSLISERPLRIRALLWLYRLQSVTWGIWACAKWRLLPSAILLPVKTQERPVKCSSWSFKNAWKIGLRLSSEPVLIPSWMDKTRQLLKKTKKKFKRQLRQVIQKTLIRVYLSKQLEQSLKHKSPSTMSSSLNSLAKTKTKCFYIGYSGRTTKSKRRIKIRLTIIKLRLDRQKEPRPSSWYLQS